MSSSIADVKYDAITRVMVVYFVQGSYYVYQDVPADVYHDFMDAPSKGRYFNAAIRNVYA